MNLSSRFKGALVAGLVGDCYGGVYEYAKRETHHVLNPFFNKRSDPTFKAPYLRYTDDTALAHCVSESLMANKGFNEKDLAKRFVKEYFGDPDRWYGENVVDLFAAMRATKCENPFSLSRKMFNGSGSYGNGGAMRVCPVPLFSYYKGEEFLIDLAKQTALVTHSHRLGYNGAILQALAIYKAMKSSEPLDIDNYIQYLSDYMQTIEKFGEDEVVDRGEKEFFYMQSLGIVKELLKKGETCPDKIHIALGTDVSAQRSVPTAIYVFLRGMTPIENIDTDNPIQRIVHFAVSLGGDTDTIATMAASIGGAFYGIDMVPTYLQKHCEKIKETVKMADRLFDFVEKRK